MLHEIQDEQELGDLLTGPEEVAILAFLDGQNEASRALMPVLRDLQKEWHGLVKFYRNDISRSRRLADRHMVREVPTLVFFLRGRAVNRIVRPRTADEVRLVLEDLASLVRY